MKSKILYIIGIFLILFYSLILLLSFFPNTTIPYSMTYIDETIKEYPIHTLNYQLGTIVKYYTRDFTYHNLGNGWRGVEDWGTWANSPTSTLFFFINKDDVTKDKDLFLSVDIKSFPENNNIKFYVNDNMLEEHSINTHLSTCTVTIPYNLIINTSKTYKNNYILEITFEPSSCKFSPNDNQSFYFALIEAVIYDNSNNPYA